MSLENQFRALIRKEVEVELAPIRALVAQLQANTAQLDVLTQLAERLG
ncbi:MAG: cell wall protein, partial [Deltaproteobacteria bacterium]|nr:cell wall protein [Deltaproteobacteria bacterium]